MRCSTVKHTLVVNRQCERWSGANKDFRAFKREAKISLNYSVLLSGEADGGVTVGI